MPLFPATFVDELKSHLDIVQIVGERVPLRKAGGASWKGLCPFHGEKTPSFNVHGDKQFFHCFGCGAAGGPVDWLMKFDKLSFRAAVERLRSELGLSDTPAPSAPLKTSKRLQAAHAAIRSVSPPIEHDRVLADDFARISDLIASGKLTEAVR